MFIVK